MREHPNRWWSAHKIKLKGAIVFIRLHFLHIIEVLASWSKGGPTLELPTIDSCQLALNNWTNSQFPSHKIELNRYILNKSGLNNFPLEQESTEQNKLQIEQNQIEHISSEQNTCVQFGIVQLSGPFSSLYTIMNYIPLKSGRRLVRIEPSQLLLFVQFNLFSW